jgi:hypothetical protein
MNLYGRPLTDPIDPVADRIAILDASETGDENKMRDITVEQLLAPLTSLTRDIKDIEGIIPTPAEVPPGTWRACRDSAGGIRLWINDGGEMRTLT